MHTNGFTLYPDGAFMMCESVGEFDPNVPLPEERTVASLKPEEIPTYVDKVLAPKCQVEQVIKELTPVYQEWVVPLIGMDLSSDLDDQVVQVSEKLSHTATVVCDAITRQLMRLMGPHRAAEACMPCYISDAVREIIGIYVKRKSEIISGGYDAVNLSTTSSRVFNYWAILAACRLMSLKEIMMNGALDFSIINDVSYGDNNLSKYCHNAIELMSLVFNDYDRMMRLEAPNPRVYYIDDLIRDMDTCTAVKPIAADDGSRTWCDKEFMNAMSHYVRKIKQKMYAIQCELLDRESDFKSVDYNAQFFRSASLIINIFALGTVIAVSEAYDVNEMTARRDDVIHYVETIQRKFH